MDFADGVVNADDALHRLQVALKLRGSHGIIGLGRRFRSMDDTGDKKLSFEEFQKGMVEMHCALDESDIHRLFRAFDADCSGYLSFDELLTGLRGELSDRRKEMVSLAFKVFDKSGDGQVSLADLEGRYDASKHPDVVSAIKDPKEVLLEFLGPMEFLETFEAHGGGVAGDGIVTFEEFCNYYGSVSASVDDDDYFELMIGNVAYLWWRWVLVVKEDGSQQVVELTDDFDVDVKNMETVKAKLREQGIEFKSVALYGMHASSLGPSLGAALFFGKGGIRTHGDRQATPLIKMFAFDHSAAGMDASSLGPSLGANPPVGASSSAAANEPSPSRATNRNMNMRSSVMFG
eukprot:gene14627-20661_t